jgi:hypothetical protein
MIICDDCKSTAEAYLPLTKDIPSEYDAYSFESKSGMLGAVRGTVRITLPPNEKNHLCRQCLMLKSEFIIKEGEAKNKSK